MDPNCKHTSWTWQNHYHGKGAKRYNNRWKKCNNPKCGDTFDNQIVPAPEREK